MEILIGIIVWLLRRLFGESEKPAEMDESRRGESPRPRSSSSSGGAPTLEELLAEVRREAEDKRRQQQSEESMAPNQPIERPQPVFRRAESSQEELAQIQKAERAERRKRQERLEQDRLEHERTLEKAPAPVGSDLEKREIKSTLEVTTLEAISPMVEPKDEARLPKRKQSKQRRQKSTVVPAQQSGVAPLPAGVAVAEMLQTIRQGSGEERRQIAQQAFVLNEIFGPCRCHRRYAPPPRV